LIVSVAADNASARIYDGFTQHKEAASTRLLTAAWNRCRFRQHYHHRVIWTLLCSRKNV